MADITYCTNTDCPFKDCEKHPSKIVEAYRQGWGYVSVANFGSVCRRYFFFLVEEFESLSKERGKTVGKQN